MDQHVVFSLRVSSHAHSTLLLCLYLLNIYTWTFVINYVPVEFKFPRCFPLTNAIRATAHIQRGSSLALPPQPFLYSTLPQAPSVWQGQLPQPFLCSTSHKILLRTHLKVTLSCPASESHLGNSRTHGPSQRSL